MTENRRPPAASADNYADRAAYRARYRADGLVPFRVTVEQTDLLIGAGRALNQEALQAVLEAQTMVKDTIVRRPEFLTALSPLSCRGGEPPLIRAMLDAGRAAGVGPMAAVAGAVAEYVGRALLFHSNEVIVENGGDVFLSGARERIVAVYAGDSPLSGLLGVKVTPADGFSVCTSSGTVGHSLSLGRADAAMVLSKNASLADAAATRLGNLCVSEDRMEPALEQILAVPGVLGALLILGDRVGIRGQVELSLLQA